MVIWKQHPPATFFRFKVYQDKTTKGAFPFSGISSNKDTSFSLCEKK